MPARNNRSRAARRALVLLVVIMSAVALSATATQMEGTSAQASRGTAPSIPRARVLPSTLLAAGFTTKPAVTGSVTLPRPASRPEGAKPKGPSTFWSVAAPDGGRFTLEKYDAPGSGDHPTVVMLHGSAGWTTADERRAATLATLGFTAVTLCWFPPQPGVANAIACPDAPPFAGVSWSTISGIDALLGAVKHLPGVDPARVALAGFSRGAGEALLHATLGGPEPVIAVSALVSPESFMTLPSETDVVALAGGVRAPTLFLYGVDDTFVKPFENSIAMAHAIGASPDAPRPRITGYRGGHAIDDLGDSVWGPAPDAYRVLGDEVAFLRSSLTVARTITARAGGGYYVLYGDGTVLARDGAPWYGSPSWPGVDIARDLAVMPDGKGYVVLDGLGGLRAFGSARALPPARAPSFDRDLARAISITPSGKGFVVLDGWGGLHPLGDAPDLGGSTYRPGRDSARDVAITPDGRGYLVLDATGVVHRLGTATRLHEPPREQLGDPRQLVVSTRGSGYGVLDRTGALWVTGGLRPPDRPSTTGDADWVGAALTDTGWVALGRDRTVAGWG
jgi:dienelactone hydrolase